MAASLVFVVVHKLEKTQIVRQFTPQGKRTVDDLNIALHGLELLEIPLKCLEILQECRLPVWTGHRRHKFIRQVRQLVRERMSDEPQSPGSLQVRIGVAQRLGSDRVDEVLGGSQLSYDALIST